MKSLSNLESNLEQVAIFSHMLLIHALGKSVLCLVLKHHVSPHSHHFTAQVAWDVDKNFAISLLQCERHNQDPKIQAINVLCQTQDTHEETSTSPGQRVSASSPRWRAALSRATLWVLISHLMLRTAATTPCSGTLVLVSSSVLVSSPFHMHKSLLLFVKWYLGFCVYPTHMWRQPGLVIRVIDSPTCKLVWHWSSYTMWPQVISLNLPLKSLEPHAWNPQGILQTGSVFPLESLHGFQWLHQASHAQECLLLPSLLTS